MKTAAIRRFRHTLRRFERVTNTHLRDCCAQVTLAQCLVLLEIDEHERLTVGQLAANLGLDSSTLSRTIDGLVRKGLLDRSRDDEDRRVVSIRLTAEGGAACESIHEQNDALYRTILERIPRKDRAGVLRGFEVLVQSFLDSEESSETAGCRDPGPRSTSHKE